MSVSLIDKGSIRGLSEIVGQRLEPERFRPNLLVEAYDARPFPEDRWVKELLVFGDRPDSARVRALRKDTRCMVVNLDPERANQNPAILRELVGKRKNLLGIYGSVERPGSVRVNDVIRLVKE